MKANGIDGAVDTAIEKIKAAEVEKNRILKCGTPQADAGWIGPIGPGPVTGGSACVTRLARLGRNAACCRWE